MAVTEIATQGWNPLFQPISGTSGPVRLVGGASISIVLIGTATLAKIWTDNTRTTEITQPLTTRSDGSLPGFLDTGSYIATWTILGQAPFSHQVDITAGTGAGSTGPIGPVGANSWRAWTSVITFAANDGAIGSDNLPYVSTVGSNLNNNPVTDGGVHWTPALATSAAVQLVANNAPKLAAANVFTVGSQKAYRQTYGGADTAVVGAFIANYHGGPDPSLAGVVGIGGGDISLTPERAGVALDAECGQHQPVLNTTDTTFSATSITFGGSVFGATMAKILPGMRIDAITGTDAWNFGAAGGPAGWTTGIVATVAGQVVTLTAAGWRTNGAVVATPAAATAVWVDRINKIWGLNVNAYRESSGYTGKAAQISAVGIEVGVTTDIDASTAQFGQGTDLQPVVWGVDSASLGNGSTQIGTIAHLARGAWWSGFAASGMKGGYHFVAHNQWGASTAAAAFFETQSNATVAFGTVATVAQGAARVAFQSSVAGDSQQRFYMRQDGQMNWGPGNAAPDSSLSRTGVGAFGMVGSLAINSAGAGVAAFSDSQSGGGVAFGTTATAGQGSNRVAYQSAVAGDTNQRFYMRQDGYLAWGPGNAVQDATLYRIASGRLASDGAIGFFAVTPPSARPAAIASPTSDTVGGKAAIDAIRAILTNYGMSL